MVVQNSVLSDFQIKKDLKATDLRNLIKDNPDGKWPEEQHGKFYESRLPTISVTKSVLCDPSNGYTRVMFVHFE
ncbi:hypothetical protein M422DRAFT_272018 [Sphaerobolus stellatus SS14]|uniref:Uncharacterized protein n=1 Tax=Sphaerobolus stellatus (strain SS14) TaxID=990650 RepID=A0A0C9TCH1_SPHS4|nr:hypothetical protein M422DRAFT_272018 [Sphaerobolus stellatus SS14]